MDPGQADAMVEDSKPPSPKPPDLQRVECVNDSASNLSISLPDATTALQPTIVINPPRTSNISFGPTAHNLLMKVGDTAGTARILPLRVVQSALKGAWGRSYLDVSEIAPNLFMAHFHDARALQFVWTKQPWSVGKEILLLEWVNPDANAKPLEAYRFAKLYVSVRFYGIPHSVRQI